MWQKILAIGIVGSVLLGPGDLAAALPGRDDPVCAPIELRDPCPPPAPCWSPYGEGSFRTIWESERPGPSCDVFQSPGGVCPGGPIECCPPPACPQAAGAPNATADFCDQFDVGPNTPWDVSLTQWWLRDLSVFAGIHGFKGPFDQGRNGNFGFHEGMDFGAPLGFWDWGWQLGLDVVHSNLSGDRALQPRSSVRNQFFFTGGLFRRARGWGMQWGITYDWLHDEYYARTDLKQIRSDTSLLLPGGVRELGYFGAYGTGGTSYVLLTRKLKYFVYMDTTDIFAFYYRRYFEGGGDGRIWVGFSGQGDGILGGEIRVPMGKSWALENRVNYLIPKHGGEQGAIQESWGVTIQLVWYPGHPARCVRYHPYRPMLSVADNTLFMTDTFVPPPRPKGQ